MAVILVVEDDILLNKGIRLVLERNKYTVISAFTYSEGYMAFLNNSVDMVLLDINLPDKSGLELCSAVRRYSQIPVIFITANDTEQEMIEGFKTGCDDYISKPFSLELLYQRIQAVLRRTEPRNKNVFCDGEITVDYSKMLVTKGENILKLTATEYRLLELLIKNRGQVMTRQLILERLWDTGGAFVDENALSVNMLRLRRKIEDDAASPRYIKTVFGIGYTWGE
jgi:DNA-binding response OmpR family regulator